MGENERRSKKKQWKTITKKSSSQLKARKGSDCCLNVSGTESKKSLNLRLALSEGRMDRLCRKFDNFLSIRGVRL